MARILLFSTLKTDKTEEGSPERKRLASSYSWCRFPGLSHLSRLAAGC
jgi:hypothetical protein